MRESHTGESGSVFDRLERYIRWQIETGQLKPGDRLPAVDVLSASLHAHPITVHKALQRLKKMGLVDRRPRLGTFVRQGRTEFRMAVLFGPRLGDENSYFYRGVLKAIQKDETVPRARTVAYDGFSEVGSPAQLIENAEYQRFQTDHGHHPFSGLIGISLPDSLWQLFRQAAPHAAAARMGLGQEVHLDLRHFADVGLSYLATQGVRQLVYLRTLPEGYREDIQGLENARTRFPNLLVAVEQLPQRGPHYDESRDTALCAALMAQWTREGRWPDGLLVSDDVTMRGVAHALVASGWERARTVRVLTWSNRGIRLHYGFPVARYELNLEDVARTLVGLVWARSEGLPVDVREFPIRGTIREDEGLLRPISTISLTGSSR